MSHQEIRSPFKFQKKIRPQKINSFKVLHHSSALISVEGERVIPCDLGRETEKKENSDKFVSCLDLYRISAKQLIQQYCINHIYGNILFQHFIYLQQHQNTVNSFRARGRYSNFFFIYFIKYSRDRVCDLSPTTRASLGRSYKCYAKSTSALPKLVNEQAIKKMCQYMKYSSEKKSSLSPSLKNWQALTSPTSAMSLGSNSIRTHSISNLTNKKQPEKQQKKQSGIKYGTLIAPWIITCKRKISNIFSWLYQLSRVDNNE